MGEEKRTGQLWVLNPQAVKHTFDYNKLDNII